MNALMPNMGMMAGGSTTQDAADSMKYYPVWQQEYADGATQLQFQEWLQQMKGGQQSSMSMNALKGYA